MKKLDKMWKVLQEAKKQLAWDAEDERTNRKHEFICNAITNIESKKVDPKKVKQLLETISNRLQGKSTYQSWLDAYSDVSCLIINKDNANGRPICQLSRHAWVDSMIKEFKEKGI